MRLGIEMIWDGKWGGMMNENKCREALNNLKNVIVTRGYDKELTTEYVKVLDDLITEHFDNPPLKFEELKQCMWVWDSKYDEYIQIDFVTPRKEIEVYTPSYIGGDMQGIYIEEFKFEENRYYRKQVE